MFNRKAELKIKLAFLGQKKAPTNRERMECKHLVSELQDNATRAECTDMWHELLPQLPDHALWLHKIMMRIVDLTQPVKGKSWTVVDLAISNWRFRTAALLMRQGAIIKDTDNAAVKLEEACKLHPSSYKVIQLWKKKTPTIVNDLKQSLRFITDDPLDTLRVLIRRANRMTEEEAEEVFSAVGLPEDKQISFLKDIEKQDTDNGETILVSALKAYRNSITAYQREGRKPVITKPR